MSEDRSGRTMLAIFLLVAAVFVTMNQVVNSAPAVDWWLPVGLFIIGIGLVLSRRGDFSIAAPAEEVEEPALPAGNVHTYRVAATTATTAPPAPPAPPARLHTMTIRPDPDTAEYTITAVQEEAEPDVLPFMETAHEPSAPTSAPVAEAVAPEPEPEPVPAPPVKAAAPAPEPEPEPEPTPKAAAPKPEPAPAPPAPKPAAKPDDLTKIVGVGPKSAAALKAAGIDTYDKLASASSDTIQAAIEGAHVRLVGGFETWAQQATYAARGDWEGMEKFVTESRSSNSD